MTSNSVKALASPLAHDFYSVKALVSPLAHEKTDYEMLQTDCAPRILDSRAIYYVLKVCWLTAICSIWRLGL